MYAWGSSNNVYIENGQNQEVTFKFAKPSDGSTITNVAIFPDDNIDIHSNTHSKDFAEYYSANGEWHKPYSGNYAFTTSNDGSATLKMTNLYRDGGINGAQGYAANRCIYVYGKDSSGNEVLLYKTNIARAATLIPPKKTGSIVLKYDQKLEEKTIREKLKQALDAPTEAKEKKTSKPLSLRDQIAAASQAFGVGVREEGKGKVVTPDDPEKKIVITDQHAYDVNQVNSINTVTSKQGDKVTTYQTGVTNLKTYLVSDLGYKSEALALTVARYDTRIDKPVVTDPNNISDDVKKEIAKKLANLNHIPQDKVTVNADGTVTINFEGVDPSLAPNLKLSDLVLKQLAEADVKVPTGDKATFVANPLGYSNAELDRIKTAILEANKDNEKLGLTSKDQITLEYVKGDTTVGHENIGISNGQAENKITVKIKTDKAVAEFTSNVKESKLTKLPNIRTDYDVSWTKTKIDGRDTDEGISWSNDSKTTIIYRYDPTKAEEFDTTKILGLLKATPKDKQAGLRDLQGGEALDHEDSNGKPRKSHMHYALKDDEPTGELSLGNMSGAYWKGDQKVSHSDEKLGDNLSEAGSYSWDTEAGSVKVAGKKGKIYKARLFVQPYAMTYYKDVYLEKGRHPGNTAKAINIIFVPQTNHKTSDLKTSVDEHKLAADKKTPTDSAYYNASDKVKKDYEDALSAAKALYDQVKDTDESKLTEQQKADIDNATIKLDKTRKALDGDATKKEELDKSITEDGTPAEGQQATTGTKASDKYKNVTDPDFKDANGNPDTKKNEAAKKAKEDYDKALEDAKALKDDENATQKAVDAAKAKLDAARAKLNDFTTNKDELSAAIATNGKVNTGDATKQGDEKLKTADPTYQNSTPQQRTDYDNAVAEADRVSKEPNASQKEVNAAIDALQKAKAALDANATNKAPLDAAVQKSFDNPDSAKPEKQSVFYKNAKNKKDNGASESEKQAAAKAVQDYDDALAKAREVLRNEKATQAQVDDAKQKLEAAEAALHADTYQTKTTDLAQALADNFSGYLMPAYFNAFDKAQKDGKDSQAAKDFKAYNDAYHAAKDLLTEIKKPNSTVTQEQADAVKKQLLDARKIIDTYATDTSRLSAAVFNDIAIKNSPAYKNLKALAEKTNPTPEEQADVEAAKKAMEAYKKATDKLHNAITNKLPRDKANDKDIPDTNIPDKNGNLNDKDYLKNIQAHKKGEPLNRDVDSILQEMNEAAKALDKFKTNTDELIKSINEDDNTKQTPAYKNASQPVFQKADSADADADKNAKAKQAVDKYGEMLNKAKDLLKDPNATQAQINEAKKNLDDARKALLGDPKDQANTPGFNTDITKLQKSVDKHGKEKQGDTAATEGTVTSDAYRNASDPHFMNADGKPDDKKNNEAKEAKAAYDKALADAQELIAKHNDAKTPQDAKPTQQQINDALKTLDEKRQALDTYKTDTTKLDEEAKQATAGLFEDSPEFKNADEQKGEGNKDNDDVKAYKEALKKARELVKAATEQGKKNSERPTQQEINDALDALTAAKKQITDNYKTKLDALTAAKDLATGDFKKTPEYKNAAALKDDQKADQTKKDAAKQAVDALDENANDSALKKAKDIIDNPAGKTQKEVDEALKTLQDAMSKVTDNYKTNADKLKNEVGDKDDQGKDVTPPFEATVEYKNALAKKDAESEEDAKKDDSATKKLKDYADKLKAAQDLIAQVNSTDPNADPDKKPTQAQVDQALTDLKAAKDAITNSFKTNASALKKESEDKDEHGTAHTPAFESSTEYLNALAKKTGDEDIPDVKAYEEALEKAKKLLEKFNDDGSAPKQGEKDVPTQQEVDEALQNLKDIKEKILANYKTNPHDLKEEVDKSKDGDDDKRDGLFEDTPGFKNATARGDEAAKKDLKDYNDKLDAAKKLLAAFDLVNGGVKQQLPEGMKKAPTQQELDAALKALQDAKAKIEKDYATKKEDLTTEYDKRNKEHSSDYSMASKDKQEAYTTALNKAEAVLHDPNATQADVDAAQKALKDALEALEKSANANRRALYEDMVIDARNALQKLVDANEATHLKDLYTHAEPAAQHEFMAAMDNAKKVLADKEALASELDAARVRLLRALDGLAKHQLPGMTNAGAGAGANGNAGANGAAGYGAHAAGAYGRGAHAAGRVRAHAGKHLAQTSDPTNALAAAGMLASALGFIAMGFKTKKRRAK